MNEKEETTKIGEMVKQRQSLKGRLSGLENEFANMAREWQLLAQVCGARNSENERYVVESDSIKVMRPNRYTARENREYELGLTIQLGLFDKEAIAKLLTDLSNTRNELEVLNQQLSPFGI